MIEITKRPQAKRDRVDHFEYIARDRISAARKFLASVQTTLDSLPAFPA